MVGADPWWPPCCCIPESLGLVDPCLIHLLPRQPLLTHLSPHLIPSLNKLPYFISGPSVPSSTSPHINKLEQAKNIASLDTHRYLWLVLRGLLTTWYCFILRHTLFQAVKVKNPQHMDNKPKPVSEFRALLLVQNKKKRLYVDKIWMVVLFGAL